MCKWGTDIKVLVVIPADLSYTGKDRRAYVKVDSCIASIVRALARAGIRTRGCCCVMASKTVTLRFKMGETW